MVRRFSLWLPPLLWCGVIFYLSSFPTLEVTSEPTWNFLTRKAAHILEYAFLGFLFQRALNYKNPFLALTITVFYATTDELHQTLVPGRTGKLSDIMFDLTGGLLGIYWLNLWNLLPKTRRKPNP